MTYHAGWTDERVATLRKQWTEGLSASQIAKELGGVSRNAVIGKVHRLGLAGRATPSRPPRRSAPPRPRPSRVVAVQVRRFVETPPAPAAVQALALKPLAVFACTAIAVRELAGDACKFPIGDPKEPGFAFCGRARFGGPYCEDHAKAAFTLKRTQSRAAKRDADHHKMLRDLERDMRGAFSMGRSSLEGAS